MEFRVCIMDLEAYNRGEFEAEWISLPADIEDLQDVVMRHTNGGKTDYAIYDYMTDLDVEIDKYADVFELNELVERLRSLEEWELEVVEAYLEATGDTLGEAVRCVETGAYDIYEARDEAELGYYLVERILLGVEVPEELRDSLDYEAIYESIGRDFVFAFGGTFYGDFFYIFD